MKSASDAAARSPCIRNCCLDDDDTCLGCFRSLEEIKEWGTASHVERSLILQNAARRREARLAVAGLKRFKVQIVES